VRGASLIPVIGINIFMYSSYLLLALVLALVFLIMGGTIIYLYVIPTLSLVSQIPDIFKIMLIFCG
jgi:hypothetical protein